MTPVLWFTVGVIAIMTYLSRALPFMLYRRERRQARRQPPAWLDSLGPCILAAMGAAILWPEAGKAAADGTLPQFLTGLGAAAAVMLTRRDAGLATLAGIIAFALVGRLA